MRRKLLEKHIAAEAVKSRESAGVLAVTVKKAEPRKHIASISEDEEMFSIQPKDAVSSFCCFFAVLSGSLSVLFYSALLSLQFNYSCCISYF